MPYLRLWRPVSCCCTAPAISPWGDPALRWNSHVSPVYIERAVEETHVPNLVTAILGDYRGYDTMFETVVIYCAGLAVVSVLRRSRS
ncbi:MAG: hydrogen gas-evolving membrane-bound hydrogenase subunit E [Syntrophotaleaceae bacterium]